MANLAAQRFYTWYGSAGFWAEGSYTATRVNSGTVRLSGTITMKCWATSSYTNGWYMDRVAVKVRVNSGSWHDLGQIKPPTQHTLLSGTSWSRSFDFTESLSASSTSFTFQAHFWDMQQSNLSGWVNNTVTWGNQSVDAGATPPTSAGLNISSVSCFSASASVGVSGGEGGVSVTVTWADNPSFSGAHSASGSYVTLSPLTPRTTYYVKATASNSEGSVSSSVVTFTTPGSPPRIGSVSASSPEMFHAIFSISGINWGECGSGDTITLTYYYDADGKRKSFSRSWGKQTSVTLDTGQDLPSLGPERYYTSTIDDETIYYTWTVSNTMGSDTKSGALYMEPSYIVSVIGPKTNYKVVDGDMFVSPSSGAQPISKVRRITSEATPPLESD